MDFEMSPESEGQKTRRLREATQTAADVTATAYAVDGSIDVEQRLRDAFAAVGIELSDDAWLEQVAKHIRSGRHVEFDDPNAPGSMGWDNGGG